MSSTKSVVISCAGTGSRLGLGTTKALININGKTLIARQLEYFKDYEDIRIVVGYQAKDVINEVLKYRKDVIFVLNQNYFETKTGTSFYLGAKDANEYVIEVDGDLIIHPDDIQVIKEQEGEFVAYSDITSECAVYVKTNENGDVVGFSDINGDGEWVGPACLRRDRIKYTSKNVYNILEPNLPIKGIKIRAWDIDTYDDYLRVCKIINDIG